jgi:hypothetical protein
LRELPLGLATASDVHFWIADRHFTVKIALNVEPAARLADQSYAGNYMSGRKSDKAHDPYSAHFHHSHSVVHFCLCGGCEQRRIAVDPLRFFRRFPETALTALTAFATRSGTT